MVKISRLIKKLESIKKKHGDIECVLRWGYTEQLFPVVTRVRNCRKVEDGLMILNPYPVKADIKKKALLFE